MFTTIDNAGAFGELSVRPATVSPDGTKLAYSVDIEGGEVYTLYIKNLNLQDK